MALSSPPTQPGLARRIWRLPFRKKLRLVVGLLKDGRVPWLAKALVPALVLYLAMPLDLIPDFIPVLGQLDDLLIAVGVLWLALRLTPRGVVEEHVRRLEEMATPHAT
jgi:uncharacterized membrane protein YkvA (DUF1232 family)